MSAGAGLERESNEWEAIGSVRHRGEALVARGCGCGMEEPDTGRPRVWKYGLYVLRSALCQGKKCTKTSMHKESLSTAQ
jgi:hypothetical protein